jgi:multimeric flavodoxin WrbA
MKIRKLSDKKPKILIFNGSPRRKDSCADQDSKTQKIIEYAMGRYMPFVDFDYVDLSVGKVIIQPCKGCISTSNGFHCHFSCTCYSKGSTKKPDLMYEADIYYKLQQCDAFIIVSPIHWYSVSTQVKSMFDRLVCVNMTLTKEQAEEIFGKDNIKNSEITGNAEIYGKYKHLLKNHLAGKLAAFYVHGDDGANDYDGNPPHTGDKAWDVKNSVMPLVYQCRYSEINAPDDLIEAFYINQGLPYYQANIEMGEQSEFFLRMDNLMEKILNYLSQNIQDI